MSEPRILAKFDAYPEMLLAFRARATERRFSISNENNHHVAGLSDRRLSQLLSLKTLKNLQSVRRVGMNSLGPLLGFLGAELWLVESKWAMDKFDSKLTKRDERWVRSGAIHFTLSRKEMREIGRKGAKVRWARKRKRSAGASKAAKARWDAVREALKASVALIEAGSIRPVAANRAANKRPAKAQPSRSPGRRPRIAGTAARSGQAPRLSVSTLA